VRYQKSRKIDSSKSLEKSQFWIIPQKFLSIVNPVVTAFDIPKKRENFIINEDGILLAYWS
jgi:hypothetical protein